MQKWLLKLGTLLNIILILWYQAYCILLASILVTNMVAHTPFEMCMLVCLHKCMHRSSDTMATPITPHSCIINLGC